jgi:hypothetical protein
MFHDAQYETLSGAKQQMDKGFAMRARITTDAATKVIPKGEVLWQRLHSDVPDVHSPAPSPYTLNKPDESRGKGKRVLSTLANRRQPPLKVSRYDSDYPPTQSYDRSAAAPSRNAAGILLPPTRSSDAAGILPPLHNQLFRLALC